MVVEMLKKINTYYFFLRELTLIIETLILFCWHKLNIMWVTVESNLSSLLG
jgi:hypothetical protein